MSRRRRSRRNPGPRAASYKALTSVPTHRTFLCRGMESSPMGSGRPRHGQSADAAGARELFLGIAEDAPRHAQSVGRRQGPGGAISGPCGAGSRISCSRTSTGPATQAVGSRGARAAARSPAFSAMRQRTGPHAHAYARRLMVVGRMPHILPLEQPAATLPCPSRYDLPPPCTRHPAQR